MERVIKTICACAAVVSLLTYQAVGDDHKRLIVLERKFFFWRLVDRPEFASDIGHYRNNDRLERFGLDFMRQRCAIAKDYLHELQTINVTALSRRDQVDYTILEDMLQTFIQGSDWLSWNFLTPFNWLEGKQRDPYYFVDSTPFDNRGDFENYIARLNLMPRLFSEYKTMMDKAIELGRTSHIASVNRVPEQINEIVKDTVENSIYSWPFHDDLERFNESITLEVREDIRRRGFHEVANVLKAYANLKEYMESTYLNHTRPHPGLGSLPGGKDFYRACLKWYLSLDLMPEELHQLGKKEIERVNLEMQKIMARQGYQGYRLRDYFKALENKSEMYLPSAEAVIAEYEHIVFDRIEAKLGSLFHDPPGLPIEVKPMPSEGSRGRYISGTSDGIRPGIFYTNTFRKWPKYFMISTAMHETNPGHHLQISYAITADLPDFRKNKENIDKFRVPYAFPSYTAYMEGWALYAESLGVTSGLYQDDYELMGYYASEVYRACRLVVDTGIHYFGWSREQAVDYFLEHTSDSRDGIEVEVDRYITWPGQAVTYKVGELKIQQLRKYAEEKLGDHFDIRDFHKVVLEKGPMPLTLLESEVMEWVDNFKPAVSQPEEEECECTTSSQGKSRCQRSAVNKRNANNAGGTSIRQWSWSCFPLAVFLGVASRCCSWRGY